MNSKRRMISKSIFTMIASGLSTSFVNFAAVGCNEQPTHAYLNVILHGLFIVNLEEQYIELLTPDIPEHQYAAGSWDRDELVYLSRGGSYRLTGVDINEAPPDLTNIPNMVLSKSTHGFDIYRNYSRHIVRLPFPAKIKFLRILHKKDNIYPTPGNTDATIYCFSLCPVLVYKVWDLNQARLVAKPPLPKSWKPKFEEETGTANLHIWAEPTKKQPTSHAQKAFDRLSDLIQPIHLYLGTNDGVPLDRDPGVLGVSREEEQGWTEWASGGETSYPSNCAVTFTRG